MIFAPSSNIDRALFVFLSSALIALAQHPQSCDAKSPSPLASTESAALFSRRSDGSRATTLEEVYEIMKTTRMPAPKEVYNVPPKNVLQDLETVVYQMMFRDEIELNEGVSKSDHCERIDLLSLTGKYEIGVFWDVETQQDYCVLATTSSRYPWGTIVINQNRSKRSVKNLSIQCPHPLHDFQTGEQAVAIYKGTNAHSLVISGAYRYASNLTSCQTKRQRNQAGGTLIDHDQYHAISDAAHSVDHGFFAAAMAIWQYYQSNQSQNGSSGRVRNDLAVLQLHGMGPSTCRGVDAYLTYGTSTLPPLPTNSDAHETRDRLRILRDRITDFFPAEGTYIISSHKAHGNDTGIGNEEKIASLACSMSGSSNLVGRVLNGVPSDLVCTNGRARPILALGGSGSFLHLEQKKWLRKPVFYSSWIKAINTAYDSDGFANALPLPSLEVGVRAFHEINSDNVTNSYISNHSDSKSKRLVLGHGMLIELEWTIAGVAKLERANWKLVVGRRLTIDRKNSIVENSDDTEGWINPPLTLFTSVEEDAKVSLEMLVHGRYQWRLPSERLLPNNAETEAYFFQMILYREGTLTDGHNPIEAISQTSFTTLAAPVVLNKPSGNELLILGQEYEISWTFIEDPLANRHPRQQYFHSHEDIFQVITIILFKGRGPTPMPVVKVATQIEARKQSFSWTLPEYLEFGSDYRIGIKKIINDDEFDDSADQIFFCDDFFQIGADVAE